MRAAVVVIALAACGQRADPRVDEYRMVRDEACACRKLDCTHVVEARVDAYDQRARLDYPDGVPDEVAALQREYHACMQAPRDAAEAAMKRNDAAMAGVQKLLDDVDAAGKALRDAQQAGAPPDQLDALKKRVQELDERLRVAQNRLELQDL